MGIIPNDYIERCYAGWLGKVIGVRHGSPIEGWGYLKIKNEIGEITGYIQDYDDYCSDDDLNGPVFFIRSLIDYPVGRALTAKQIGRTWLNYAPYEHSFYWWGGYGRSTEHTAYLNLRAGIEAPRSGSAAQNGYAVAEQIGGQIFIDTWGLMTPGDPDLAAEFAAKAASVSHDRNGIYGGQFVAAAISAAFTMRDIEQIIETALARIPADCEYARMVRDVIAYYHADATRTWRDAIMYVRENWGYDKYPVNCYIIRNSAVMILSMLYGKGDFSDTINICNMCGYDTDCNVGNVATILGVMNGIGGIAESWKKPVHDFLAASSVIGCRNILNLPAITRMLAKIAYSLAGEEPPREYAEFMDGDDYYFDFTLPGSTCSFRSYEKDAEIANSGRALRFVPGTGDKHRLYYRTYCKPENFTDGRYEPDFSPVFYPGMGFEADVRAAHDISLRLYAHDVHMGEEWYSDVCHIAAGEVKKVSCSVPGGKDALINEVGFELTEGSEMEVLKARFTGSPDYVLDFSKESMEIWQGLHRTPAQITYLKGIWDLADGKLLGSCADYGAAYTGLDNMGDAEITCEWEPDVAVGQSGFCFRVQGAIRGYALTADANKLYLLKNDNGYSTLCEVPCAHKTGDKLSYMVKVKGNLITVADADGVVIEYTDNDNPYMVGMTGFTLENGGHALFEKMTVKPLW